MRDALALGSALGALGASLAPDSRRTLSGPRYWGSSALLGASAVTACATGLSLLAGEARPVRDSSSRLDAALSQFEESNSFVSRQRVLPWGVGALALSAVGLLLR